LRILTAKFGGLAVAQKFFDDIPWATIAANAEGDDDY